MALLWALLCGQHALPLTWPAARLLHYTAHTCTTICSLPQDPEQVIPTAANIYSDVADTVQELHCLDQPLQFACN